MSDLQAIADRVEIEALRGEFTDAVMLNDHDRLASLFTHDGAVRIPDANLEAAGREEIRAMGERREALADYFVQTTHPGAIQLDGDTASGRAYLCELIHSREGNSHLNYAVYHDRPQHRDLLVVGGDEAAQRGDPQGVGARQPQLVPQPGAPDPEQVAHRHPHAFLGEHGVDLGLEAAAQRHQLGTVAGAARVEATRPCRVRLDTWHQAWTGASARRARHRKRGHRRVTNRVI
jgi:ketosteroid isomerase-like protein